jgi:lipopolysaccharide/colanic/teichoic acid biosynthesis glycosyltransferase
MRDLATRLKQIVVGAPLPAAYAAPGIYSVAQFAVALERERARADRNGHQISLALMPARHADGASPPSRLLEVLKGRLRVTDEAGWYDESRLGVLMPYTSCQGAWRLVEDLCRLTGGELSLSDCRVYLYPCDRPPGDNGQRTPQGAGSARGLGPGVESLPAPSASAGPMARIACVCPLEDQRWAGPSPWQRGLDIVCSLLALIVLAPLLLLAALLIRLVSSGPVFFKQVRIGRGGKPFVLWKFRTMVVNADTALHRNHVARQIRAGADHGAAARPMSKLDHDPRVIPGGGVLRRTCIDELPQLLNVLRGEMSLVGPRPPIPYEVSEYQRWQKRRLDTLPGLTGLWQVSGKNRLTFEEMVRLDIRYSRRQSLWLNIRIILRTPGVIVQDIVSAWGRGRMRAPDNA